MNLLIKKIERVGHGFRNFDNYRLRLLLLRRRLEVSPSNTNQSPATTLGCVEPVTAFFGDAAHGLRASLPTRLSEPSASIAPEFHVLLRPTPYLVVLVGALVYELLRIKADHCDAWLPCDVRLLGPAPTAAIASSFLALLLARQQYARSVYPSIGGTGDVTPKSNLMTGLAIWKVRIYKGG